MSRLSVVRRRLASMDEAVEVITREWSETSMAGYESLVFDRCAVNVLETGYDHEQHPDGVWLTVADLVRALQGLRGRLGDVAMLVEQFECAAHTDKDAPGNYSETLAFPRHGDET